MRKMIITTMLALSMTAFAVEKPITRKPANGETQADTCEGYVTTLDAGSDGTIQFSTSLKSTYTIANGSQAQLFMPILSTSFSGKLNICVKKGAGNSVIALNLGASTGTLQ